MPKHRPPARHRYDAAHPTVTARVPTAVKDQLYAVLEAEHLTLGQWLARQVGETRPENVMRGLKTRTALRVEREATHAPKWYEGVGFWAGLIAAELKRHAHGRPYSLQKLLLRVRDRPEVCGAIGALMPEDLRPAWYEALRDLSPLPRS